MWSQIVLCLLVGFAYASKNPGWKDNTEYVYNIRGRTLASLHEVDNQYSGILLKARLTVQPRPDGKLQAEISDAKYSQVHSWLSDGWNTDIADSELNYKPLGMSGKPFQIDMKYGVISDVIVSKDVSNWEANIIKSIMSQFQLNTNGARTLHSKINSLLDDQQNSAVFKTMEETVTGNTETLYDIHPIPEYILQSEPWVGNSLELKGDGEVIEVVKHKNYSNNDELPLYHYGFADIGNWKPGTNQMGKFFIRDSISRAILTGNLGRFTVHNSYTVNRIVMNPTLNNKEKGSVVSMVNVTLEGIQSQSKKIGEVSNPIQLGNLVYTYDNPNSGSNGLRTKKPHQGGSSFGLDSEEYDRHQSRFATMNRLRRSLRGLEDGQGDTDSSSDSSESKEFYKQDKPKLNEGLGAPLLPYFTGDEGKSIKEDKDVNIKQSVRKMAQEIGNELQNPEISLRKNTLDKFTTLSSLIRLMNSDELQQIARDLYSQAGKGPQYEAWSAFRDAVAESGTGPAFITIQDWIHSKKLDGEEGAQILSTMAGAVRQPTLQYMQSFFDFIRKPEIQSESPLNETALMSFTNLIRKVYVDKKKSGRQYPVESFGSFRTDEGKKFVEESVIPYLTQELHEAVSRADTYKIHAFIRALGNVGHPKILKAFKPYLEGKKQASQFQRFLMVASMDKLVETHPEEGQSVLFKVYRNAGESQEVRVVAVHQLMRTSPPTDMLQRMASYTNIDAQEHVNAAVKSSIESAADLEGDEYKYLRSSAQAAQHLLTKKNYGAQHGSSYLHSYVAKELNVDYKVTTQSIGSEDRYYPKGVKYSVRANLGGMWQRLANVQAMVSSIDELLHVGLRQTASYQQQQQKQAQNGGEQGRNQFSSQKIAQMLNMKGYEREQLEGSLWVDVGGYFEKFISFDNHTIERLPEEIRKYEEEFKKGKVYQYTKLKNTKEMALSFPTEMGLPFLFTYDTPVIYKVKGEVNGAASPQLWQGNKLHKPDTVTLNTKMQLTINSKIQGRLSFSTPFDHHRYISGFDKNFQMHIPLYGKFHIDIKNGQLEAEIEPMETHQGARLFHYSTWPYTSMGDIKNFQPISSQRNTYYIEPKNLHSLDKIVGKKQTGMALRVQMKHERKSVDLAYLTKLLQEEGIMGALSSIWDDASMQHSEISVQYLAEQSTTRKYILRMGFQHKYKSLSEGGKGGADSAYWKEFSQVSDPLARKDNLINKIGEGIKNAEIKVYDASIEFQGEKNIKYTVTGGYGKSNIDPVSRVMMYFKKSSGSQDVKPYEITLKAKSNIPNTNGLDLSFSWKHEPKVDTLVEFTFGESQETSSQIKAQLGFRRSEERKQFLKEQSTFKKCEREMLEGNYQLPACANMTMNSNLLDRVSIKMQYEKVRPEVLDTVKAIYEGLLVNYYPTLHIERNQGTGKPNEIKLHARFDPDLRSVNVSIKDQNKESTIKDIHVGEWAKKIVVVHPVFHVRSRIEGWLFGLETYRQLCVVDSTQSSTFNNKTYPGSIGKHWTVMFQYVPKDARHQEQQLSVEEKLKSQTENYAVLVRENPGSNKQKDVKITVSSPETDFKVVDITMQPGQQGGSSGAKGKVTVNGKEVGVSDQQSHDLYDGYVQIYSLPNGEVKVEIRDKFYTIYDGQRVKLTITDGKFRDSVRGVCGAFSDDQAEDFLTPENCIARDPQKFVRGYEIEGGEGQQQRQQFSGRSSECIPVVTPLYVNIISEQDSGRTGRSNSWEGSSGKCSQFQTRYVEENGEICFTIRPLPACSSRCQQRGTIRKSVSVHCVQNSNVAKLWKNQIDGGSSPNFSHKKESRTVQMEYPQGCSE